MPACSMSLRAAASGSSPVAHWPALPIGAPVAWASMPTASMTASVPRPPVRSRIAAGRSLP